MKVPEQHPSAEEVRRDDVGWLRVTRRLLFGIGGFDGNASLAVLADTLDEELAGSTRSQVKGRETTK